MGGTRHRYGITANDRSNVVMIGVNMRGSVS